MPDVEKELQMLSRSLVNRIRVDLSCGYDSDDIIHDEQEGDKSETKNAASRRVEELASRLVRETLIPLFHKLHPEKSGWDLSLMNICAANMSLTAASAKDGAGRDISKMFRTQEHVLKEWKAEDVDVEPTMDKTEVFSTCDGDTRLPELQNSDKRICDGATYESQQWGVDSGEEDDEIWQSDDNGLSSEYSCATCGHLVPHYAIEAHERFHDLKD
ncbi:MAG: hypothetical protein Q9174_000639 [Haloplaca sp. 1 TL-2023]